MGVVNFESRKIDLAEAGASQRDVARAMFDGSIAFGSKAAMRKFAPSENAAALGATRSLVLYMDALDCVKLVSVGAHGGMKVEHTFGQYADIDRALGVSACKAKGLRP